MPAASLPQAQVREPYQSLADPHLVTKTDEEVWANMGDEPYDLRTALEVVANMQDKRGRIEHQPRPAHGPAIQERPVVQPQKPSPAKPSPFVVPVTNAGVSKSEYKLSELQPLQAIHYKSKPTLDPSSTPVATTPFQIDTVIPPAREPIGVEAFPDLLDLCPPGPDIYPEEAVGADAELCALLEQYTADESVPSEILVPCTPPEETELALFKRSTQPKKSVYVMKRPRDGGDSHRHQIHRKSSNPRSVKTYTDASIGSSRSDHRARFQQSTETEPSYRHKAIDQAPPNILSGSSDSGTELRRRSSPGKRSVEFRNHSRSHFDSSPIDRPQTAVPTPTVPKKGQGGRAKVRREMAPRPSQLSQRDVSLLVHRRVYVPGTKWAGDGPAKISDVKPESRQIQIQREYRREPTPRPLNERFELRLDEYRAARALRDGQAGAFFKHGMERTH